MEWLIFIAIWIFVMFLGLALARAAAPRNSYERLVDDLEQMKALGYFDETITSGCPVENNE